MIRAIRTATLLAAAALSGTAANAVTVVSNTTQNSVFTVSNTDLLQTNLASTSSSGNFAREGEIGLSALTDGGFGALGSVINGNANLAAATADGSNSVTYALDGAYNLTSIATYAGWDAFRGGQSYTVSVAKAGTPGVFQTLGTVFNNSTGDITNTRALLTSTSPFLATNVVAVKFAFGGDLQFGYAGYREIDVVGSSVPEASTWALLVVGFGLVGFSMRRRGKVVAA